MALKVVLRTLVLFLYIWVSSVLLLFHGPFPKLREFTIETFTTSMHSYLLRPLSLFTLSNAEIKKHSPQLALVTAGRTDPRYATKDYSGVSDTSIQVLDESGSTFSAKVMLIRDPKRVAVAVTQYMGKVGQTVPDIVAENHAIAGINGGAFRDTGWQGTGGIPLGITIVNGKVVEADNSSSQTVVGFTDKGAMVAGPYQLSELQALGVKQALTFGPVIVQNGQDMVEGIGGLGYAPRTAIGQTADGTVIMVVTDGRLIHGPNDLGASLQDVAQIMLKYHAVVAVNLDGGSSATMVKDGKLVNQPTDVLGPREVATAFIVMPN